MKQFKVMKLDPTATLPTRAHSTDCGLDIYTLEEANVEPGQGRVFKTGIAGEFLPGYVGMLTDRSSMAKKGFKLAGGIIDPGYTGELMVVLRNITNSTLTVSSGDRIAQLLIIPIETPEVLEVTELSNSERSSKGFGSSGA
jgi:dUTP pyrophosphatase